jgi:hypothetical protein
MLGDAPESVQHGWCDAGGAPIALFSRLHQRGQVVGLGPEMLYVRFPDESQLISVAPALTRVLDDTAEGG